MFFIVSGFLIFWSFDADQNKKRFYIKRFFRIFPLYAFLIILQTLFFIGFSDGSTFEVIKYFIANIFFLNFLAPSVGSTLSSLEVNAINGSLWTLKNEVVFYLIVPLLFIFYKKFGKTIFYIFYILSVEPLANSTIIN
jgi:peptidoglycan/LPS O-acetylase OafA/YrhL